MKIVADANIVHINELYQHHGDLVLKSGREICAADVCDAQVLIVRSITRVDESLLAGSQVRLVLTATSGTDHLDLEYLARAGIAVKDAAGSNATAVVEYCLAAMSELILQGKLTLQGARVGIVGFGHVGSRLYRALVALGVECVVCDPYVQRSNLPGVPFCTFDTALACPIVTFHTPLTRSGEHPTQHLINRETLGKIQAGTLLINAARGAVVDNEALYQRLKTDADMRCVLDVWENEPDIHQGLLGLVDLGTPHIAGYSVEAKMKASQMNVSEFESFFDFSAEEGLDEANHERIAIKPCAPIVAGENDETVLAKCLAGAFSVAEIDEKLRACANSDAATFDDIRKQMTGRREFSELCLDGQLIRSGVINENVAKKLQLLGFAFKD